MTWGQGRSGLGAAHVLMLQAIAAGKVSTLAEAKRSLTHRQAAAVTADMMRGLVQRGYVSLITGNRYQLTPLGWRFVPGAQPPIEASQYAPPSYKPTRAGAMDYARLPSVAAGVARPYWAEGLL